MNLKKTVSILILLTISSTVFADSDSFKSPYLDAWNKYFFEGKGKFPEGCFFSKSNTPYYHGKMSFSVCENPIKEIGEKHIAPVISSNYDFYLEKEYRKDGSINVFGSMGIYAGGLEHFPPHPGVHACIGEENNGKNPWGLTEFTEASLTDAATKEEEEQCIKAGGEIQSITKTVIPSHYRIRKSNILAGLLPVRRECLSVHVVLKCGFNNRKDEIKQMTDDLQKEFPSNPVQDIFNNFVKDL